MNANSGMEREKRLAALRLAQGALASLPVLRKSWAEREALKPATEVIDLARPILQAAVTKLGDPGADHWKAAEELKEVVALLREIDRPAIAGPLEVLQDAFDALMKND